MVKEGIPFVLATLMLAAVFAFLYFWIGGIIFLIGIVLFILLTAFMAYFFRDPQRNIPNDGNIIVSAADGHVTRVEERENGKFVSVFLSPLDVHINRAPIAGKIVKIEYIKGKKNPATSNEASLVNERNALTIEGDKMTVICTQIAGIVARRIVCWSKTGDNLELGEKFGLIKFSSRTDLLMPKEVEVLIKIGDRVVGGETIIAKLN
ncbi:MAG TPA: phosphatidylserine decarboxylase [Pyrinomonadaceae bacterium]|jgi:phosphatidylserine decarboxylase|nr:phosphatidylserine decarboxylase [Pyrinomonadaceae bacterium]